MGKLLAASICPRHVQMGALSPSNSEPSDVVQGLSGRKEQRRWQLLVGTKGAQKEEKERQWMSSVAACYSLNAVSPRTCTLKPNPVGVVLGKGA